MIELADTIVRGAGEPLSVYKDLAITNVVFENAILRAPTEGVGWTRISNISLKKITHINCTISCAAFEDVSLKEVSSKGASPLFVTGCVFRRVTLEGKFAGLIINPRPGPTFSDQRWDQEIQDYYQHTEWALDISAVRFTGGVSLRAIPGDKIRRDPEHQVLIRRSQLADHRWRSLDFEQSAIDLEISHFLRDSFFDSVVVAARLGSKYAKLDLRILGKLKESGIAE